MFIGHLTFLRALMLILRKVGTTKILQETFQGTLMLIYFKEACVVGSCKYVSLSCCKSLRILLEQTLQSLFYGFEIDTPVAKNLSDG